MTRLRRHPVVQSARISQLRLKRRLSWRIGRKRFATKRTGPLAMKIFRHQSVLLRKLGDADMRLQQNKIQNLGLAAERIDGVVIQPGETFSLWRLVGKPTEKKGYLEGMLLSNGEVRAGIGGGLCQMANLLYWMFLHTPLVVTERHHHSVDVFPDSGRVLPFGSGATIYYNYVDLQVHNPTDQPFQINVWLTDEHLKGEIRSTQDIPERYHVFERDHQFLVDPTTQQHYRANKIYREIAATKTGSILREELLMENFSKMKYAPPEGADVKILAPLP